MQQSNPNARPSGKAWTVPNEQAWIAINGRRMPKTERQAWQHFMQQVGKHNRACFPRG